MKTALMISVSVAVLIGTMPARADECNFNPLCEASRFEYWVTHGNQPAATLTTTPSAPATQPAAPAAPAGPVASQADISNAQKYVTDLAITGVITKDQADQANKVIAAGGGNLIAAGGGNVIAAGGGNIVGSNSAGVIAAGGGNVIAAGGGNVIAAGGGNMISSDSASVIAANALALVPGASSAALKSQIASSLVSDAGGTLQAKAQAIIDTNANIISGFKASGMISDVQATALSKVVAAGGGNVIAAGGGNVIAAGGGNLVGNASGTFTLSAAAQAALIAAGGGNVIAAGGGNVIAAGGGNLLSPNGGNVIAAGGGNLLSPNGGNVIAAGGGNLVGNASGTMQQIAAINGLISEAGGALVGAAQVTAGGYGLKDVGDKASAVTNVLAVTKAQDAAAAKALVDVQTAATNVRTISANIVTYTNLVNNDSLLLQNAQKDPAQQGIVGQLTAKLAADQKTLDDNNKALTPAGVVLAANSTLVAAKDADTATKLIGDTINAVQKDSDAAKANSASAAKALAAAAAPAAPTAAQIAAANAVTQAQTAATAAANSVTAVQALTKALGTSNPTTMAAMTQLADTENAAGIKIANSNLAKAQADLATLKANPNANKDAVAAQQALVTKAQSDVNYVNAQVANNLNLKVTIANNASSDLANAKAVVDGLTKAYGGNRPADPQQNANITAAMVVVGLAQDKLDAANADATMARLKSQGASASDIKTQQDILDARTKDMQGILKVNPTVLAAAGVSGVTDPAAVTKAINSLVTTASTQATSAVQQTSAAVQTATAALAQAKAAPAPAPVVAGATTAGADAAASLVSSLKKTSETLSSMAVSKPVTVASNAPTLPGSVAASTTAAAPAATSTASAALNPTGGGAPVVTTLNSSGNPISGSPAQIAAAAVKDGFTPALVAQLTQSGGAVLQAMQTAQAAALAKGDKATADGLAKDIVNLKGQIETAKIVAANQPAAATMPAPASNAPVVATTPAATPAAPAGSTPVVVASASPAVTTAAPAAPAAPVVDKSELTPAVVQQLLLAGPAVVQGLQAQQAAALAKGDKATADGLGKDIASMQAQIAAAKAMPALAATVAATTPAPTAPVSNAVVAAPAATPAAPAAATPVVVASASPTAPIPATQAAGATTPANAGTDAAAPLPVKLTAGQGKDIQKALSSIPGNTSKADAALFSKLSTLVTVAASKGLVSPDDVAALTNGLKALADKHPKAEKQLGLTAIAKAVEPVQKPAVAVTAPAGGGSAVKPVANAAPTAMPGVTTTAPNAPANAVKPVVAATPPAGDAHVLKEMNPEHAMKERMEHERSQQNGKVIGSATPKSEPAAPPQPVGRAAQPTVATTTPAAKIEHNEQPKNTSAAKVTSAPPAPPKAPPAVAAPKPPTLASTAPKAPAPPAPKAQNCTPNMQNGKMMGMICH